MASYGPLSSFCRTFYPSTFPHLQGILFPRKPTFSLFSRLVSLALRSAHPSGCSSPYFCLRRGSCWPVQHSITDFSQLQDNISLLVAFSFSEVCGVCNKCGLFMVKPVIPSVYKHKGIAAVPQVGQEVKKGGRRS